MLKEQIATVANKAIIRFVAIIIVASTIVGQSMITTLSAASADRDINSPVGSVIAKQDTQINTETYKLGTHNRNDQQEVAYISSRADVSPPAPNRAVPSGIELIDYAANNTDGASKAPIHPTKLDSQPEIPEIPVIPESLADDFVYVPQIPLSEELQRHTYNRCKTYGLTYSVVLALMWRESRFQVGAVGYNTNGTRDHGVMQINDVNKGWLYSELGISNLMDPVQNISAGTEMLGRMTKKHGMQGALMAYQYGEQGMLNKLAQGITSNKLVQILYSKSAEFDTLLASHTSV